MLDIITKAKGEFVFRLKKIERKISYDNSNEISTYKLTWIFENRSKNPCTDEMVWKIFNEEIYLDCYCDVIRCISIRYQEFSNDRAKGRIIRINHNINGRYRRVRPFKKTLR